MELQRKQSACLGGCSGKIRTTGFYNMSQNSGKSSLAVLVLPAAMYRKTGQGGQRGIMGESRENEKARQQQRYLEGLKRYYNRGIPIYIDGKLSTETEWRKIFETREDGGFYMGDYVGADEGCLKEIRFDRIYLGK